MPVHRLHVTLLAAALLAPASARAAAPADAAAAPASAAREQGLSLGLRAGYGLPFGDLSRDAYPLSDLVRAKALLQLEAGWRFGRHLRAGLHLELARTRLDEDAFCAPGIDCAGRTVRLGVMVHLHLGARGRLDPWVGVGAGFETLTATVYDDFAGGEARWSWTGLELPVLEAGLDVLVLRGVVVGPVLTGSFARFSSYAVRSPGTDTESASVERPARHGWLMLCVKAGLRL